MIEKKSYHDGEKNKVTLDKLCRLEPAWAANRIRALYDMANYIYSALDSGDPTIHNKIKEVIEKELPEFELTAGKENQNE